MNSLHVQPSAISGSGLFTRLALAAGAVVLEIAGREVNTDDMSDDEIRLGRFQGIAPGKALVSATGERGLFSYVNHSSEANCVVDLTGRRLVALRGIAAGEELTVDYALEPFDERVTQLLDERIRFLRRQNGRFTDTT